LKDHKIPLEADNVILRGSILRNTEFIYGVTVFTGHETKIMMNSTKAKMKFSNLDVITNKLIYLILGV
jgi:phospholipid-transporting ATPase